MKETEPKELDSKEFIALGRTDDETNAQCFVKLYGDKFCYTAAYGWLCNVGSHWESKHAEERVNRGIIETIKARLTVAAANAENENAQRILANLRPSNARKNAVRSQLQDILIIDENAFDSDPDLLNCANGVLNLKTGELTPHCPEQRFTYCLPTPYQKGASSRLWVDFLAETVGGGKEDQDFLQTAVGYSLTGHTREEILFYLQGPTRSGKGTFTETLLDMYGFPLSEETDFTTFTAKRDGDTQNFDLAGLKPCRFIAASESHRHYKLNAPKIKQLTGGNRIRCAFKGRDMFTYRPQFKIWLSSNFTANLDPDDDAAWARVRVIRFPYSHLGKEDKLLKFRLKEPDVLTGVLAWAVEGAQRWYASKAGLQAPKSVMADTQADRDSLDYIAQFIDEHYELVTDPEETEVGKCFIPSKVVFETYKEWAETEGHPLKYQGSLIKSMVSKGFRTGREIYQGKQQRCVVGIREKVLKIDTKTDKTLIL